MSHFTTVVIVEPTLRLDKVYGRVEQLLAPFDENLEVEPYLTTYRFGDTEETEETTRNPVAKWDWWRIGGRWSEALFQSSEDEGLSAEEVRRKEATRGAQEFERLLNENGLPPRESLLPALVGNICRIRRLPPSRLVTVKYGFYGLTPDEPLDPSEYYYTTQYAIVTPDGKWHQRGEMGWFGMASDEMSNLEWSRYYSEVLSGFPEHLAVLCDLHI